MRNWGYWRWQVFRNLPFAALVGLIIATLGFGGLIALPTSFTASARLVLERPIGLSSGSKAQSTAEEVQHLQVVTHVLRSRFAAQNTTPTQASSLEFKIETSRDKPSFLLVTVSAPSEGQAVALVQAVSSGAIRQSEEVQGAHEAATLGALSTKSAEARNRLALARDRMNAHLSHASTTKISDLEGEAAELRKKLRDSSEPMVPITPDLAKLYSDLSNALSLYSDIHPKVRLIRSRIERKTADARQGRPDMPSKTELESRIADIEAEIDRLAKYVATTRALEQEVASATSANQDALDALEAAQSAAKAARMRLKIIRDPAPDGLGQQRRRLVLLTVLALLALSGAIAAVALRIRLDDRLYRPRDLRRGLGLTPFATLPDLGPSLS